VVPALIEPTAHRIALAHPGKLRVIAESKNKTDKLDAQTLAEFLALDQIPQSWRPTPRVREHRALVRLRAYCQSRITSAKNKLRRIVAHYNADRSDLFSRAGRAYLKTIALLGADRLAVDLLCEELDQHADRLKTVDRGLKGHAPCWRPFPAWDLSLPKRCSPKQAMSAASARNARRPPTPGSRPAFARAPAAPSS
jgi:transposase